MADVEKVVERLAERVATLEKWQVGHDSKINAYWEEQHRWNDRHDGGAQRIEMRLGTIEKKVWAMAAIGGCIGALVPQLIALLRVSS